MKTKTFATGHVPDPAGHKVTPIHRLLAAAVLMAATPPAVSLRVECLAGPGILDQKQTGSCVGHAIVGAAETCLAIRGTPVVHHSPVCVYDVARCIDRVPDLDAAGEVVLPPLEDIGCMPNQAIRGTDEWGVCLYEARPTDETAINDEPSLAELEGAADFRIHGVYRIDATGKDRVQQIRAALASGYPVCFAVQVGPTFMAWAGGEALGAPPPGETTSGHYVYAVGYTTRADGTTEILFANSWGEEWGEGGFGRGDEAFIEGMIDVYVMDVHPTPMQEAA